MSELHDSSASYCPHCGEPVSTAQSTVADSAFATEAQGVIEDGNKHIIIDGAQVSAYILENDGGGSP